MEKNSAKTKKLILEEILSLFEKKGIKMLL